MLAQIRSCFVASIGTLAVAGLLPSASLAQQCTTRPLAWNLANSMDNVRAAIAWDEDGPGPSPIELFVGGWVGRVPSAPASIYHLFAVNLATQEARPLTTPQLFKVRSLTTTRSNALLAAGDNLRGRGFVYSRQNERWTLRADFPSASLNASVVLATGELLIGGSLLQPVAGGPSGPLVRWDGTTWRVWTSQFGEVTDIISDGAGGAFVVGQFDMLDNEPFYSTAKVSPQGVLAPLGAGLFDVVHDHAGTRRVGKRLLNAAMTREGELLVATEPLGLFRWDGAIWSDATHVASAPQQRFFGMTFATDERGDVFAGGYGGEYPEGGVAKWTPQGWVVAGLSRLYEDFAVVEVVDGMLFVSDGMGYSPSTLSTIECCDPLDFNGDALFPSDEDVIDFFAVLSGGVCGTGTCGDLDFNNDGSPGDDADVLAFVQALAGAGCRGGL